MERRPTPDPGATESAPRDSKQQAEQTDQAAREQFVENEGLANRKARDGASTPAEDRDRLSGEREAAAQRGHSAG
jgi:hypothetical protein